MIIQGHALEVLATIPDEFFDCIITNPQFVTMAERRIDNA